MDHSSTRFVPALSFGIHVFDPVPLKVVMVEGPLWEIAGEQWPTPLSHFEN